MVAISRPLAVVLVLLGCGLADAIPRAASAPAPKPDFFAAMRRQPMIFFVVKGAPNACGPGCSEWIAADGVIDQDAGKRLHDFVAGLPRRDLPIFFHSTGGSAVQAMAMGVVMREHRMTAAVGRTFPEGCRNGVDDACRRLLPSKSEHKGRLVTAGTRCLSGCVYALVGASVRHVARDALLGIHSARILPIPGREPNGPLPTVDDLHRVLKRYVIEMGVDPGLIDAAAKISADTVRFLSRDEIARFGIEVRDFYETSWMLHQQEGTKQQIVFKSVTRAGAGGGRELRTGNIRMWCTGSGTGVWLVYRRETPANEEAAPVVRVAAGDREYKLEGTRTRTPINPGWTKAHEVLSRYLVGVRAPPPGTEDRTATVSLEFLRNATADAGAARVIKLSTGGLAKALQPLLQDCAPVPKFFDSPAVKFLDGPGPSGSR